MRNPPSFYVRTGSAVLGLVFACFGCARTGEGWVRGVPPNSPKPYTGVRSTLVVCPACESRIDVTEFPDHSTVGCPFCGAHFTY